MVDQVEKKAYDNTMTYAQKIQNGIFIPKKAMQNHTEVMELISKLDMKMSEILTKLTK
jgi:hypothetical protein|tara:strand:- start:609 stop:782 length:174 start_codon:yes stop_codon:yes gene_type:complete